MKMRNRTRKFHDHLHFKLVHISKHHVIYILYIFGVLLCEINSRLKINLHAFLKDCKLNNSKKNMTDESCECRWQKKRDFSAINLFMKLCTSQNNHVSESMNSSGGDAGWAAQPVPPVSTAEGIIHPLRASLSQLAPITPLTLPPVYPSVSQWEPFSFFLTATSHSSICVATVCSFSTSPKMTFIAAASLKQRPLMFFGGTGSKQTELPKRLRERFPSSFVSL